MKNISCVILAAGMSTRMKSFKPLLKFNNLTFIENIIYKTLPFVDEIIVVTGFRQDEIVGLFNTQNEEFCKVKFVFNSNYHYPMFNSLQLGLNEVKEGNWVLYHFVDQPTIPKEFYGEFLEQINPAADFIQPVFNDKKGHPLLFNFNFVKHLVNSNSTSNLRDEIYYTDILKKYWVCNFKEVLNDYDTPEQYNNISKE